MAVREWNRSLCLKCIDSDEVINGDKLDDLCCEYMSKNGSPLICTGVSLPGLSSQKNINPELLTMVCS